MRQPTRSVTGVEHLYRRLYYRLKPFLPDRVRWALRKLRARSVLETCGATWPINERAGFVPADWPGWPDGKRFAMVLTHDVEGARGVAQVRKLAELELEFELCSSFNLIPEGSYAIDPELRPWLIQRGFEIGVHDLHHDGHLFSSKQGFLKKAARINDYLAEWGAVGFRSGFMLHEIDWLPALHIEYDCSTFDTDPFEPQPDGVNTVFPYLLEGTGPDGSPCVELPYTLPQDSTLFLLLGEKNSDIWKRKLDWLVERGAMALVIIHPDYIDFGDGSASRRCYPVARVREFFEYLTTEYRGAFWNPKPAELAGWYRETVVRQPAFTP